jgi:hypothetical protein
VWCQLVSSCAALPDCRPPPDFAGLDFCQAVSTSLRPYAVLVHAARLFPIAFPPPGRMTLLELASGSDFSHVFMSRLSHRDSHSIYNSPRRAHTKAVERMSVRVTPPVSSASRRTSRADHSPSLTFVSFGRF